MKEQEHKRIQTDIRLTGSGVDTRLFLNSTGAGIPVDHFNEIKKTLKLTFPIVYSTIKAIIEKVPIIHYGLCKGGSDLIGIHSVIITPDMIGKRIGVFVSIEIKTEDDKARTDQENFINTINSLGGRAGIARNPEEAIQIIKGKV